MTQICPNCYDNKKLEEYTLFIDGKNIKLLTCGTHIYRLEESSSELIKFDIDKHEQAYVKDKNGHLFKLEDLVGEGAD